MSRSRHFLSARVRRLYPDLQRRQRYLWLRTQSTGVSRQRLSILLVVDGISHDRDIQQIKAAHRRDRAQFFRIGLVPVRFFLSLRR